MDEPVVLISQYGFSYHINECFLWTSRSWELKLYNTYPLSSQHFEYFSFLLLYSNTSVGLRAKYVNSREGLIDNWSTKATSMRGRDYKQGTHSKTIDWAPIADQSDWLALLKLRRAYHTYLLLYSDKSDLIIKIQLTSSL